MNEMDIRFWAKVDRRGPDECWEWRASRLPAGYGVFTPHHGDRIYAHRYSWMRANGPIPSGLFILHHCDNPPCVNPGHLYAGTQADNMRDRDRRGRRPPHHDHWRHTQGELGWNAKLTNEKVYAIRRRLREGERGMDLAAEYGISKATVTNIKKRNTWAHLPDLPGR